VQEPEPSQPRGRQDQQPAQTQRALPPSPSIAARVPGQPSPSARRPSQGMHAASRGFRGRGGGASDVAPRTPREKRPAVPQPQGGVRRQGGGQQASGRRCCKGSLLQRRPTLRHGPRSAPDRPPAAPGCPP
jgi:hypothetical protein